MVGQKGGEQGYLAWLNSQIAVPFAERQKDAAGRGEDVGVEDKQKK